MRERVCSNCGGRQYKVVGQNMVKCEFCGTLFVDEQASKEEVVLVVGANEILRNMRFEDAVMQFDKILETYPRSFEAYYGKALAKNKIIIFPNKRGIMNSPRFFGKVVFLSQDADFKKAISLAPEDRKKEMLAVARNVDKICREYSETYNKETFDVVLSAVGYEKPLENEKVKQIQNLLQKDDRKVYFLQDLKDKENEAQSFRALETAKILVFIVGNTDFFGDFNLIYRYQYFISLREKPRTSLVLVLDDVDRANLPKIFTNCQSVFNAQSSTFLEDFKIFIENEIKNFVGGTAKIETVKVEQVAPTKKTYVDIANISPQELGTYQVENVNLSKGNKTKWIFLCLKNGDFQTAKELIETELKEDPYSSELLFASLLAEKKIKTQDEFFDSISNFTDKEKIESILRYANREFAEFFVDHWETLIQKLDDEQNYIQHLEYLAGFSTPNRDAFVSAAEEKAVSTMNQQLIDSVEKCFKKDEVERFINFYFHLAQNSEDEKYYKKILEIDAGHFASNVAMFLQHFKTDKDKLSFRNKEEFEAILKFMSDEERSQIVSMILDEIFLVAYIDLNAAQQQFDFYLAYISVDSEFVRLTRKIAEEMQRMRFFVAAEKYIGLAISKSEDKSELYWILIQILTRCCNEKELITSQVKIMQMPEWQSLLEFSSDEQANRYAQIISKANTYKGEKLQSHTDYYDMAELSVKLSEFLQRNEKILLELEQQKVRQDAVNYFKAQLEPFKLMLTQLDKITNFNDYQTFMRKLITRLSNLDLTLDMSISTLNLENRFENLNVPSLKNIPQTEAEQATESENKSHKKFLQRFFAGFLEGVPIMFTFVLLLITFFSPKDVYMWFGQDFIIMSVALCALIGVCNFAYFMIKKKKISKGWKAACLAIFVGGMIDLLAMCSSFYIFSNSMTITSANELKVLMGNARYAHLKLNQDIDFGGKKWKGQMFAGNFDGLNYKISNIVFSNVGFVSENTGKISNLIIQVEQTKLEKISSFGTIAAVNRGTICNCTVSGTYEVDCSGTSVIGGLVGENRGGTITNCTSEVSISLKSNGTASVGGLVGEITDGQKQTNIQQNYTKAVIDVESETAAINLGGLVGQTQHFEGQLTENVAKVDLSVSGTTSKGYVGGLVGYGLEGVSNSHVDGTIEYIGENGFVGGLFGGYINPQGTGISKCYAVVDLQTSASKEGYLVGQLVGRMDNCFVVCEHEKQENSKLFGNSEDLSYSGLTNCIFLDENEKYNAKFGFDEQIWVIDENQYPLLIWEIEV